MVGPDSLFVLVLVWLSHAQFVIGVLTAVLEPKIWLSHRRDRVTFWLGGYSSHLRTSVSILWFPHFSVFTCPAISFSKVVQLIHEQFDIYLTPPPVSGFHGIGQEEPFHGSCMNSFINYCNIVSKILPVVNTIKINLNFLCTLNCIIIGLALG